VAVPVPQGIFSAISYSSLASTFALALLSQLCKGIRRRRRRRSRRKKKEEEGLAML
jgi:TRAP-type C4-dicarboxylate transport system permease small subunit